ncbi:MAG: TIGR01212 family radical SAM protein, partial [Planctomycetota bacterium]|nr:TIGR01212 family radical SAM protein [Planctomycetota bacterium]
NVDGTISTGGCIFCSAVSFSPSLYHRDGVIARQISESTARITRRYGAKHFLAYFQPGSNTHAPVQRLRSLWEEALAQEGVVGLVVGTRPDCVGNDVLDLLQELAERTWVSLELGLQSAHDSSLEWLRRGHDYAAFVDTVERAGGRGLHLGAHVILGLPGETRRQMAETAAEIGRLGIDAVKIHNLFAAEETPLAEAVRSGILKLSGRDEYIECLIDFLERIPPECVIDRLIAEVPSCYLVGPAWCQNKNNVLDAIHEELRRRDTWQGRYYAA